VKKKRRKINIYRERVRRKDRKRERDRERRKKERERKETGIIKSSEKIINTLKEDTEATRKRWRENMEYLENRYEEK